MTDADTQRQKPSGTTGITEKVALGAGLIGLVLAALQLLVPAFEMPLTPSAAFKLAMAPGRQAALANPRQIQLARLFPSAALIPGLGGTAGSLRLTAYPETRGQSLAQGGLEILVSRLEYLSDTPGMLRAPAFRHELVMTVDKSALHPKDHRILPRIAALFQSGKDKSVFRPSQPVRTVAYDARRIRPPTFAPATGALSARFESGGEHVRAIGYSVTGGTCYGLYQIASRPGTLSNFFKHLEARAPDWATRLRAAGRADTGGIRGSMPDTWRAIAEEDPRRFAAIQHDFINRTHYEPALRLIHEQTGLDLGQMSAACREVLWSAAVQHGPGGAAAMFGRALASLGPGQGPPKGRDFEKALIEAVYEQRRQSFGDSPLILRTAVAMRFDKEKSHALELLLTEPKKPGKLIIIGAKPTGEDS